MSILTSLSRKTRLYLIFGAIVAIFYIIPVLLLPQETLDAWSTVIFIVTVPPIAWLIVQIGKEEQREEAESRLHSRTE